MRIERGWERGERFGALYFIELCVVKYPQHAPAELLGKQSDTKKFIPSIFWPNRGT